MTNKCMFCSSINSVGLNLLKGTQKQFQRQNHWASACMILTRYVKHILIDAEASDFEE